MNLQMIHLNLECDVAVFCITSVIYSVLQNGFRNIQAVWELCVCRVLCNSGSIIFSFNLNIFRNIHSAINETIVGILFQCRLGCVREKRKVTVFVGLIIFSWIFT